MPRGFVPDSGAALIDARGIASRSSFSSTDLNATGGVKFNGGSGSKEEYVLP